VRLHGFRNLAAVAGLVHGFSGRTGGTSEGPYASLNLSYGVGDEPGRVRENRLRYCAAIGVEASAVAGARQDHGTSILAVDRAGSSWAEGAVAGAADALVTCRPGVLLVQTAADCALVAVLEPRGRIAGIAHCGWRGSFAGLASALVRDIQRRFGVAPADLLAAISPSIGPCCFEVGEEVVAQGRRQVAGFERFVRPGPRAAHVDLWEMNRAQLLEQGLPAASIEVAQACTRCRSEEFFSYRAGAGKTGIAALAVGFA
jgi:YfiH family protein